MRLGRAPRESSEGDQGALTRGGSAGTAPGAARPSSSGGRGATTPSRVGTFFRFDLTRVASGAAKVSATLT